MLAMFTFGGGVADGKPDDPVDCWLDAGIRNTVDLYQSPI